MLPTTSILIYFVLGVGIAVAVYVSDSSRSQAARWFSVATALPFWPLYVPILLARRAAPPAELEKTASNGVKDDMAANIAQVDAELDRALNSLDGWAEDVLAREKDRIHELRLAWTAQSERIREMDRLLSLPEYSANNGSVMTNENAAASVSAVVHDRLRHSQEVRKQNLERLRQVRRRAYEDLMGTLAWVRELVSMIHLAKFTGAPASRAEELVAQIAAAVEGLTELTWQDESFVAAGDNT
jgi:hypothetical protein